MPLTHSMHSTDIALAAKVRCYPNQSQSVARLPQTQASNRTPAVSSNPPPMQGGTAGFSDSP